MFVSKPASELENQQFAPELGIQHHRVSHVMLPPRVCLVAKSAPAPSLFGPWDGPKNSSRRGANPHHRASNQAVARIDCAHESIVQTCLCVGKQVEEPRSSIIASVSSIKQLNSFSACVSAGGNSKTPMNNRSLPVEQVDGVTSSTTPMHTMFVSKPPASELGTQQFASELGIQHHLVSHVMLPLRVCLVARSAPAPSTFCPVGPWDGPKNSRRGANPRHRASSQAVARIDVAHESIVQACLCLGKQVEEPRSSIIASVSSIKKLNSLSASVCQIIYPSWQTRNAQTEAKFI
eukprot:CAMPEP_0172933958 /NCGR_PEP_ID=MMETSP1075-20121228/220770_1 /TAXON_ID=2916 /ORGANISM="Ceratium fusus, Strain PA161109" /LENGTH=291 /DNA_ID=CAMNT_0013795305 /DNA_START=120 /DNA_END=997 /DNA_ORIENTATION=+